MLVGMDIGGTKVRAGIVSESGRLAGAALSVPTKSWEDPESIFLRISDLLSLVMDGHDDVRAIGIGSTGPLDPDKGVILECNNLPTMHGFHLKERIEERFGLPVSMDNDANAFVLGEAIAGSGAGCSRVLGITLGTGLGAALAVDGKIVRGARNCCGEIWASPYGDGIIEDYLSGTALSRMYKEISGADADGAHIASLARAGDRNALSVFERFTDALSFTLAWIVNMTDPDVIVIGGSVATSADLFLDAADKSFRRYVCPEPAASVKIRLSLSGADAGVIGAAALARELL